MKAWPLLAGPGLLTNPGVTGRSVAELEPTWCLPHSEVRCMPSHCDCCVKYLICVDGPRRTGLAQGLSVQELDQHIHSIYTLAVMKADTKSVPWRVALRLGSYSCMQHAAGHNTNRRVACHPRPEMLRPVKVSGPGCCLPSFTHHCGRM